MSDRLEFTLQRVCGRDLFVVQALACLRLDPASDGVACLSLWKRQISEIPDT